MPRERAEVSTVADERAMLDGWLEYHRATLGMKCDGLSAEQLRARAVPPSTLSLLGLVRHMAEVERGWFRNTFMAEGAPGLFYTEEDRDGDFNDLESAEPAEVFSIWGAECDRAREVALSAGLDDLSRSDRRRDGNAFSMRWILMHMIEEYARHNGHADLIREAIDGSTGD